jgi:two-component system chemotaxis response regulator CheY
MARVLVIDDDPSIRQVVTYVLTDEGHEVAEAADGAAALAAIARQHPDVILLDMKMPGLDGWAFVERYRARYGRRAPIVVLTAAQDAARRAAEVEAEAHLAKPFDLDAVIELVAAFAREVGPGRPSPPGGAAPGS